MQCSRWMSQISTATDSWHSPPKAKAVRADDRGAPANRPSPTAAVLRVPRQVQRAFVNQSPGTRNLNPVGRVMPIATTGNRIRTT